MNRYLLYLFTLTLLACTAPHSQPKPPTAIPTTPTALSTPHPTQPPISTATPQVPTAIPIPTTLTNPTIPITTEPTLSSLPPFTEGQIYFLWSPHPPPDGPDTTIPTHLYRAIFDPASNDWLLEPVISDLFGSPSMILSPNHRKIAVLFIDDPYYFQETYQIYIYDLFTSSMERLTDAPFPIYTFGWLPDNETIVYPQDTNLFLARQGSRPEQLTNNLPFPAGSLISKIAPSPDGRWVALYQLSFSEPDETGGVTRTGEQIALHDMTTRQTIPITEIPINSRATIFWSPNSQWFALKSVSLNGLLLVNGNTGQTIELAKASSDCYPQWSPDGQKLAFSCGDCLALWDSNSQAEQMLVTTELVGEPVWSPDGKTIATGIFENQQLGLIFFDLEQDTNQIQNIGTFPTSIEWSPDAQELLFFATINNRTGYYFIYHGSGSPFLFLDTTDLFLPHDFIWLPVEKPN